MADNGFGVSFMPNGDQLYKRPGDPTSGPMGGQAPVQDPIKILQMRIPRVVGANPLAPLALMGPNAGAQGLPAGLLEQLLRTLGAGPRLQADPGTMDPNSLGVNGAPSPIARTMGLMPSSYGSTPLTSVTAGMTDPGAGGGAGAMPPVDQPPQPTMPADYGPTDSSSEDYWTRARDLRSSMGRITQ